MKLAGIILMSIGGGVLALLFIAFALNVIWDYELFEDENVNGKYNGSILGTVAFVSILVLFMGLILFVIGV
ncbi:MAG: hypothetical protein K2M89_06285 [Clostridiales bacterium]|nr:hypothetical protein [Clostridiales bacterium]